MGIDHALYACANAVLMTSATHNNTLKSSSMLRKKEIMNIGTPFSKTATKVLLCGAGELGKEVAIELQRLGIEVIACDRYDHAPAMQVADRTYCFSMLDGQKLREVIEREKPDYIVPEIEAIATDTLVALEAEGWNVIPSAKATHLTMNREGIRKLVAEELALPTSPYRFAESKDEFWDAVQQIGIPCVVKPIMSSSGKGQSVIQQESDIFSAWEYAQVGGRAGAGRVIIEGWIDFDYEITLLTIQYKDGIRFCAPIGHRQEQGDYQESWQPQPMREETLQVAQQMAKTVTEALGGWGLFGVEFFIQGENVYFSELSPRPHDTGLVTLISQDLSEFALHVRAILGLPIPNIVQHGPSASKAIVVEGHSSQVTFGNLEQVLASPNTQLKLFGKPEVQGKRRMGVVLAREHSIESARATVEQMATVLKIESE